MSRAAPFALDVDAPNVVPSRYRQVAVAELPTELDDDSIADYFVGREAYMRTVFIAARRGDEVALVEVARQPSAELFSPIESARVVADSGACRWVNSPDTDVGIPSQMATIASAFPAVPCIIVEGRYGHVSFLLNPRPLVVEVLDIVPPTPSKLLDQARRVLDVAEDLPPIVLRDIVVDSRDVFAADPSGASARPTALLPCRVSGDEFAAMDVAFLDQRPERGDWTLLGCQRSQEIHRWFYGQPAPMVDVCPRRFLGAERATTTATLTRCCLLQEGVELRGNTIVVPWGASLDEIKTAFGELVVSLEVVWTPI